jgi:hypothetical protein
MSSRSGTTYKQAYKVFSYLILAVGWNICACENVDSGNEGLTYRIRQTQQ